MFFSQNQNGFSFLGFVVVLALIAFLLMIAIPQYLEYRERDMKNSWLGEPPVNIVHVRGTITVDMFMI